MRTDEEMMWKTLSTEYVLIDPWMTVRRDRMLLPSGEILDPCWALEYPDWVSVIAITTDGRFVFERQYRHGLHIVEYEIPAGVTEEGETPLQAARRELAEETGYGGGQWEPWMVTSANPSVMNNLTHVFLARGVEPLTDRHLDRTEDIEVYLLSEQDVLDLLASDSIKQSLMAAPLWKYFASRGR
jgi:8-oxo-dGTP pyrophosphatase MutT (NUDIX family)